MPCRRARRDLQLRSDDRLPFERELALGVHLEQCAECRAFEATLERIDETLARWPEPASDRIDLDAALSTIRARIAVQEPQLGLLQTRSRRMWIAAAAMVVALVAGALARHSSNSRTQIDAPDESRIAESSVLDAAVADSSQDTASVAPSVVATHEAASVEAPAADSEPIDPRRVAAARERLTAALLALGPQLPADASTEAAREFATRVDEALRAEGSWPWRRMADRLLREDDIELVTSAARYVGIDADRLSIGALAVALERVECAGPVALALRDADAADHSAIAAALRDPERFDAASAAVVVLEPTRRSAVLDEALRGLRVNVSATSTSDRLLSALTNTGPAALPALIEAVVRGDVTADQLADRLTARAWAADELVAAAWRVRPTDVGDATLQLAARVAGAASLDALEDQIVANGLRSAALRGMVAVGDPDAFARIVNLHGAGYVDFDATDAALHSITDEDPTAARGAVLLALERADRTGDLAPARTLASWVLSLETSAAVPALRMIAFDARCSADLRHDALLAIGDLGGFDDAEALIEHFAGFQSRDKRLAAACLIAIHRLGGDVAAERALVNADPHSTRSVLTNLNRGARRDHELSTHRLARALVPLLTERGSAEGRSEP